MLEEAEAQDGWTYASTPAAYISNCNGVDLIGGYNAFAHDPTSMSKTFSKNSIEGIFFYYLVFLLALP